MRYSVRAKREPDVLLSLSALNNNDMYHAVPFAQQNNVHIQNCLLKFVNKCDLNDMIRMFNKFIFVSNIIVIRRFEGNAYTNLHTQKNRKYNVASFNTCEKNWVLGAYLQKNNLNKFSHIFSRPNLVFYNQKKHMRCRNSSQTPKSLSLL